MTEKKLLGTRDEHLEFARQLAKGIAAKTGDHTNEAIVREFENGVEPIELLLRRIERAFEELEPGEQPDNKVE